MQSLGRSLQTERVRSFTCFEDSWSRSDLQDAEIIKIIELLLQHQSYTKVAEKMKDDESNPIREPKDYKRVVSEKFGKWREEKTKKLKADEKIMPMKNSKAVVIGKVHALGSLQATGNTIHGMTYPTGRIPLSKGTQDELSRTPCPSF